MEELKRSGRKTCPVTLREDTPSGTVIEFKTSGYYLSSVDIQGKTHTVLSVPKAVTFLEKGYPELPRISRSIIIPDDAKMKFEIVEAEYETTYVAPIAPSKGSLPRSVDPKTVPYTFSDVYKMDMFWPQQVIELSEPFIMRDVRGITVRFNLFRYNAVKGQLITCKKIVVRIFADGIDNVNVKTERKGIINLDFLEIYERFFLNFYQYNSGMFGKVSYLGIGERGRMLIIAADDFYNSMIPLRDWRTRKGHKTTLVKCSDVGTTWGHVKTYIQNMYNSSESVIYILLVGEANLSDIPTKSVPSPDVTPGNSFSPKDPIYALLEGGPTDPYPDAYVSRISAENVDQVDNQVMRILKYETNPVSGSWFQKACGIASYEGYPTPDTTRCNWLRDDLLSYGYISVDKLYNITSPQPIANAINDGRGVVNYLGHGLPTMWGFRFPRVWPLFSVTDVQSLTNTILLPFIFSVACEVGSFSEEPTCFAEAWLRAGTKDSPKGAIGFYGSSIIQPWDEPCIAQAEAVDLLVAEAKVTIGGLCFNGSCKMIQDYPYTGPEVFNNWHIFGDAATQVWTKTPKKFTSVSIIINGSSITVNTDVDSSTICVSSIDNGATFWDRQDNVRSYTWNTSVRPLYNTISKHNYIPYQVTLQPGSITITSQLSNGWNMASVPVSVFDFNKNIVWSNSNSDAFAWEGGPNYVPKNILENRIGYWIRFPQSQIINYTGIPKDSFHIGVKAGWNMIGSIDQGIPISKIYSQPPNITISHYYGYDNNLGYFVTNTIQSGKAYWIKVNQDGKIILDKNSPFSGNPPVFCTTQPPVNPPGAPAIPKLLKPDSGATGISVNTIFRWRKSEDALSYRLQISTNNCFTNLVFDDSTITDTLKQVSLSYSTKYFWRVSAKSDMATSSWSNIWEFITRSAPWSDPCEPVAVLSTLDNFTITDANGKSQSLYTRNAGRAVNLGISDFEMPPIPPKGVFNVRFQSNKFIETILPNQKIKRMPIVIQDAQYPLNISWNIKWQNNITYWLIKPNSSGEKILLSGNGNLSIGNGPQNEVLFIEAQAAIPRPCEFYKTDEGVLEDSYSNLPTIYKLEQNRPNPFNPSTQIICTLPVPGHTSLKIYDVLGREVAVLVNELKDAGVYEVVWDASAQPSGVYFYKLVVSSTEPLQSGNFVAVKKMLLVR